jgi:hypothetical protein
MNARRIIGLVLIIVGIVALLWGGVFWKDRDTILNAGPLKVQTEHQKGFNVPPIAGVASLVVGCALLFIPDRRRV